MEDLREPIDENGYKIKLGLGLNYFITQSVAIEPSLIYEYKSTKRAWLIEGSFLERYLNEKNIIVGIKLNFSLIKKPNQPINPTAFSHSGFLKFLGWLFRLKFVVLSSSIN